MGYLEGFTLKKMQGGLGRTNGTADSTFLLVCHLPNSIATIERNKLYRFIQIEDAEKLGINESFDANNNVLAHYHLTEIFRLAPDTELFFMAVEEPKLQDNDEAILTALRSENKIKGIACFGFSNDLSTLPNEVEMVQSKIVEEAKKDGVLLDFVLVEGKGKTGLSVSDLEDLKTKNAPQISIIIGQDTDIAKIDANYKYHSCIGSALGMLSVRSVAENLGSVDIETKPKTARTYNTYPLTGAGKERFINAGVSTGEMIGELSSATIKDLTTGKGYILVAPYVGVSGFYFSNSPTCVSSSSDYCYIENNRVWNKSARLVREALVPRIKSKLKKDKSTGYLKASTTAYLENLAKKAIERMVIANEISGFDVYINPKQSVTEDNPLKVKIRIVTDDILHGIEGEIGLTKNLE